MEITTPIGFLWTLLKGSFLEVFGDNSERYIDRFREILEDISIDDILEQNDLLPEEALFLLFQNGYLKNPFNNYDA